MLHFHDEFDSLPFFFSTDTELHGFVDLSIELKEQQWHNGECCWFMCVFAHNVLRDEMSNTSDKHCIYPKKYQMIIIGNEFIIRYSWVCGSSTFQIAWLLVVFLFIGLICRRKARGLSLWCMEEGGRFSSGAPCNAYQISLHFTACNPVYIFACFNLSLWDKCDMESDYTKVQILARFLQRFLLFTHTEWLLIQQWLNELWVNVNELPHSNPCFHTDHWKACPRTDSHSPTHNACTSLFPESNGGNEPRMRQ